MKEDKFSRLWTGKLVNTLLKNNEPQSDPLVPTISIAEGLIAQYTEIALDRFLSVLMVKRTSASEPTFKEGLEEEGQAALFLLPVFRTYLDQFVLCLNGQAYFAATVMGAATLEALLMLAALGHHKYVSHTAAWKQHFKNSKSFITNLKHAALSLLNQVGMELKWFAWDLPSSLKEHYPSDLFAGLEKVSSGDKMLGTAAQLMMKEIRNYVHPAKALRDNADVVDSMPHRVGAFFVLLSLTGFIEEQARSKASLGAEAP